MRQAWKEIEDLHPTASDLWQEDFFLLKAKLLEDTSAYAEAVELLTQNGGALSQDPQRAPLYYFLLGVGYRGAGDAENAKQALFQVVAISGESDLGKAAKELLKEP